MGEKKIMLLCITALLAITATATKGTQDKTPATEGSQDKTPEQALARAQFDKLSPLEQAEAMGPNGGWFWMTVNGATGPTIAVGCRSVAPWWSYARNYHIGFCLLQIAGLLAVLIVLLCLVVCLVVYGCRQWCCPGCSFLGCCCNTA